MRRLLGVVAVLTAMGCSRDLSLPEVSTLAIEAPRDAVAPRQKIQLSAVGGAQPYTFTFAPNGKDSGELASLSSDGLYQAGERGLTQDTIRVTDSAGVTALVLVTVGAPLSIAPPVALVAPGGRLRFVAAGGLPPWRFSLVDGGVVTDGDYQATGPGDRVEEIILTDATDDPAAVARAQVSIGNALVLFPGRSRVAPRERVGFVALGGQPPYAFSLGASSSSGGAAAPTIDPATGAYVAGSNDAAAQAVDEIVVTDANQQTAHATVEVGLPLTLSSVMQLAHPGVPVQLEASGGRPPYSFAFQPRGNRSRGVVDSIGGDYVPGSNTGAIDLLQVTDVTGSVALAPPIQVGALQLQVPFGGTQVVSGNFDGDGRPDLALHFGNELVTVLSPSQPTQLARREFFSSPAGSIPVQLMPFDDDGDGRDDLYATGHRSRFTLRARFGGRFDLFEQDVNTQWGFARAGRIGNDVFAWRRTSCQGIERVSLGSLARLQPDGGFEPAAVDCVFPNTGDVFAVAANAGGSNPGWVSWFPLAPRPAGELSRSVLPMELRYFDPGTGAVTRSVQVPLPPGHRLTERARLEAIGLTANGVNMILDGDDQVGPDRLVVLVDEIDGGTSRLWGIDTVAPSTAFLSPTVPTAFPAAGLAGAVDTRGEAHLAAWDTRTGRVPVFALGDAGVTLTQTLEVAYPVCSATFVDIDLDGERDLVTTSIFSSRADVFWSDGDGTFGKRARFNVDALVATEFLDVDGDGVTDVISGAANSLNTYFGVVGQRQLAVGPRTQLLVTPGLLMVEQLDADGRADLFFRDEQGAMWVALGAGPVGAFAPPAPVVNAQGQQDVAITSEFWRADFGGGALGADVLTTARDPVTTQLVAMAIVRTSLTTATRVFLQPTPGAFVSGCAYTPLQLDTGPEEIIAGCFSATSTLYFVSRASGSGSSISFSAWQPLTHPLTNVCGSVTVRPPPGDARRFMICDDKLVVMTGSGGNVNFATHTVPLSYSAIFAPLRPQQAEPDLVLIDALSFELTVNAWSGSTWVERQRFGVAEAYPLAAFSVTPGAPPDVVIGREPSLSFLANDGGTLF